MYEYASLFILLPRRLIRLAFEGWCVCVMRVHRVFRCTNNSVCSVPYYEEVDTTL